MPFLLVGASRVFGVFDFTRKACGELLLWDILALSLDGLSVVSLPSGALHLEEESADLNAAK